MVSRLTFRERVSGKAWQRIIREKMAERYQNSPQWWEGVDLNLSKAIVRECSWKQAEKVILEYEWLGTMTLSSWHTGLFFDGWACGGVCCFCVGGGGVNAHVEFGIDRHELAYLSRGACVHWAPDGSASKLIGWSLRLAKRKGLKVALAYSDTDAGEIGTVYQATNWLCIGRGSPTVQMLHPVTGKVYDQKVSYDRARATGFKVSRREARSRLLQAGFKEQLSNPKWRYCYILASGTEYQHIYSRIANKIVPYPKRPKDSSEPPVLHTGEGGATPTRTLQ